MEHLNWLYKAHWTEMEELSPGLSTQNAKF